MPLFWPVIGPDDSELSQHDAKRVQMLDCFLKQEPVVCQRSLTWEKAVAPPEVLGLWPLTLEVSGWW